MSIYSDMELYYRRTWLRYRLDGNVYGLYVENVGQRDDTELAIALEHSDDISNAIYQGESSHMDELTFIGRLYNENGRQVQEIVVNFDDPNILWDLPDEVGYFNSDRNGWSWYCYCPTHSAKKGFTGEKLKSPRNHSLGDMDFLKIFLSNNRCEESPHKDLLLTQGIVFYKGTIVGSYSGDVISLKPEVNYLTHFISTICQGKTVEVA